MPPPIRPLETFQFRYGDVEIQVQKMAEAEGRDVEGEAQGPLTLWNVKMQIPDLEGLEAMILEPADLPPEGVAGRRLALFKYAYYNPNLLLEKAEASGNPGDPAKAMTIIELTHRGWKHLQDAMLDFRRRHPRSKIV